MNTCRAVLGFLALAVTSAPASAWQPAEAATAFSTEQLEQLVAPIALYPDPLLTQVLMAATYPLEIVEAARWVEKNKGLAGDALEQALQQQDWDASVKSLCGFPDVLAQMNENLDWSQDLGDAVLAQEQDLLAAVQRMRAAAQDAGNLATTEQQTVSQDGDVIVVQPASSEVVYVPVYPPSWVYGSWTCSHWYYPAWYGPVAGRGRVAFHAGVHWGAGVWGSCDWHHGNIDVDVDRYNDFDRRTCIDADRRHLTGAAGERARWTHDAAHRQGVNYRDAGTAAAYGAADRAGRVGQAQARGRTATTGALAGTPATRDGLGGTPSTRGAAGTSATRESPARDSGARSLSSSRTSGRSTVMSGASNPSLDRSASARGMSSRASASRGRGGGRRG